MSRALSIHLIAPAYLDGSRRPIKERRGTMPCLSLPFLAALTPPDHEVRITDEIVGDVDFETPVDLVAITAYTSQIVRAYQIADEFRRRGVKVAIGGIHAFACPEEAAAHADALVLGEAEDAWPTLLADLARGRLEPIYRHPHRNDLAGLPVPRMELMPLDRYARSPFRREPILPIWSARGCPYACDFCSVPGYLGRGIRRRPVEEVVRDIRALGHSTFLFTDDNIAADREHARALFTALEPLGISWVGQFDTLAWRDEETLALAAAAGCDGAFIGLESLSPDALKAQHKGFNKVGDYERMFDAYRRHRIPIHASIIFGFPQDTPASMDETVRFLEAQEVDIATFWLLTPYPGTPLCQRMMAEGRIAHPDWADYTSTRSVIRHDGFAAGALEAKYWAVQRRFYALASIYRRVLRPRKCGALELAYLNLVWRSKIARRVHPLY